MPDPTDLPRLTPEERALLLSDGWKEPGFLPSSDGSVLDPPDDEYGPGNLERMPPAEILCCGTCAHFSIDNGGECRIMPPAAFVVMQEPDPAMTIVAGQMSRPFPRIIGGFPPVQPNQWCSAHSEGHN